MSKNRSRQHKFTLYLSDDEKRILCAKFEISGMRSIYQADMDEVKGEMEKLWKVQKVMLKRQPVMIQ